jgi:hypothetical protein
MPSRRRVLVLLGSVALGGGAGCLSTGERSTPTRAADPTDSRAPDRPTTPASTTLGPPTVRELTTGDGETIPVSTYEDAGAVPVVRRFVVGEGEYHNGLRVWNDAGERDGRVVLSADGDDLLTVTERFPANGCLDVRLRRAADYTVEVRLGAVDHTVSIPSDRFDCNEWAVEVGVHERAAEDRTVTTLVACAETAPEPT